jgi:hypothetical protein
MFWIFTLYTENLPNCYLFLLLSVDSFIFWIDDHIISRKRNRNRSCSVFLVLSLLYLLPNFIKVKLTSKNCTHFQRTRWCFDICTHCEMIKSRRLSSISISRSYHFFLVRPFKIIKYITINLYLFLLHCPALLESLLNRISVKQNWWR